MANLSDLLRRIERLERADDDARAARGIRVLFDDPAGEPDPRSNEPFEGLTIRVMYDDPADNGGDGHAS